MSFWSSLINFFTKKTTTVPVTGTPIVLNPLPTVDTDFMHISEKGLTLIKYFEGTRLTAYKDSKGVLTIGTGHTGGVKPNQTITQEQADAFLASDVKWAEDFIKSHVEVTLQQNQFDAIVSFVFNVGVGNFQKSGVLTDINNSNFSHVPYSLSLYNMSGGKVVQGLVTRRHAKGVLFSNDTLDFTPVHAREIDVGNFKSID